MNQVSPISQLISRIKNYAINIFEQTDYFTIICTFIFNVYFICVLVLICPGCRKLHAYIGVSVVGS